MSVMALPIEQWDGLRVLAVREPWATLIVTGQKDVENRSRKFGHRGPLLIHASGTLTRDYYDSACSWTGMYVEKFHGVTVNYPCFDECKANCGKIIGGCEVADCVLGSRSQWYDGIGWGLVLTGQWKAVEPVPFKGQLNLATFRTPVIRSNVCSLCGGSGDIDGDCPCCKRRD